MARYDLGMDYGDYSGPMVGVGVIVRRADTGQVLMGLRAGSHGAGEWALPGGKVDAWESPAQTAVRELAEEAALAVADPVVLPFWSDDRFEDFNRQFITLYLLAEWQGDEPVRVEPHKCLQWGWFSWDDLPRPHFSGLAELVAGIPDLAVHLPAASRRASGSQRAGRA